MKKIKVIRHNNINWYNIFEPTKNQLEFLKNKYNFHPLDIEDCFEEIQRPKLDIYKNYLFLVLHFPVWDQKNKTLKRAELNVFLGPSFLITINDKKIPLLDEIFYQAKTDVKKRSRFFKNSSYYLFYFIFNQLLLSINLIAKQISKSLNELDLEITTGNYKNVLEHISTMRRNLILFQTIIKPQIPIFKKLEQGRAKLANSSYAYYWGNLVDRLSFIWEEIEDFLQLLEGLAKTNESLLSYKTNEVIKILTIFSVVLMPLTLISGIYGMNINTLPFLFHPSSFLIITVIMVIIVTFMLIFFKIKKWV